MIMFIISCLTLALLQQNRMSYLEWLSSPIAIGLGITIIAISLVAGYLKKLPSLIWHDMFCCSVLMVWYGYWKLEFNEDAPMFFFYPLYFAILSAITTLMLINRCHNFDDESIAHLRYLHKMMRFDIYMAAVFVLVGLWVTWHYALFATAMTFFIFRHSINVCVEKLES